MGLVSIFLIVVVIVLSIIPPTIPSIAEKKGLKPSFWAMLHIALLIVGALAGVFTTIFLFYASKGFILWGLVGGFSVPVLIHLMVRAYLASRPDA